MENYTKDKRMLNQTSIRLKKINKQYEDVAWEKEVLEQRYEKVSEFMSTKNALGP